MQDSDETDLAHRLEATTEALRDAEGRATAAQHALETMHEIRNPLEALGNFVYLAGTAAEKPDEVREYMRMADEQLSALRELTLQSLSFSRVDSAFREVDFVSIADAALRMHNRMLQSKKIHLVRDHADSIVGSAHAGQMLQLMSNMLANALDVLHDEGAISIRLRRRGEFVHFLIRDNGPGIPAEYVQKIFDPFFSTKGAQGTGLGLALSKRIIESHGGKIRLRTSVRPSQSGTAFRISLPTHR